MGRRVSEGSEFDVLRRRAKTRGTKRTQAGEESIKRRFAALGNLSSGASIQQQRLAREESQRQTGEEIGSVDIAQAREDRRQKEIQSQRVFQTGERVGSQEFAGKQAGLSRGFAAGEALKGREFAGEQAGLQRRFATGEREAGQTFGAEQAGIQRRFQSEERFKVQAEQAAQAQLGRDFSKEERRASERYSKIMFDLGVTAQSTAAEKAQANAEALQTLGQEFSKEAITTAQKIAKEIDTREFNQNVLTNKINTILSAKNSGLDPAEVFELASAIGIDVDENGEFIITPAAPTVSPTTTQPVTLESLRGNRAISQKADNLVRTGQFNNRADALASLGFIE